MLFYIYTTLLFCLTALVPANHGLDEDQRDCNAEGKQIALGSAWYECRIGKYVPVACVTSSGARVDIEQSYIAKDLLVKCKQTSPSSISFETVGCIAKGHILKPGETAHDDTFWFLCTEQGDVLKVQMPGCLGQNDAVVNAGGIVKRGSYLYKCNSSPDGKLALTPQGCILNDKEYSLGDVIETDEGYWYKCSNSPDSSGVNIEMMGCVRNGMKINAGDQFDAGGFKVTCRVKPILNDQDLTAVKAGMSCTEFGQSGTVVDHAVGTTWNTGGNGPIKYVVQCTQEGLTIKKSILKCYYDGPESKGEVESGCYKRFGDAILQCSIKNFKDVQAQLINQVGAETEQRLQSQGFKSC